MNVYGLMIASALVFAGACFSEEPGSGGDSLDAGISIADARPTGATDAGASAQVDAMPGSMGADAAPGGTSNAGIVNCGDSVCDLSSDICCVSISGSQCVADGECGGGFSAPQYCDGPEDCGGGQRCCAVFSFGGDVGSFCRDDCDTNASGNEAELCHVDNDCDGAGDTCRSCQFQGAPTGQNACAGTDIPACNN